MSAMRTFGKLGTALLLSSSTLVAGCATTPVNSETRHLSASSLTVEHMPQPLGIDARQPRFGWILDADFNGAAQTAYEVQVFAADSQQPLFSSGKVESGASFDLTFPGLELASNTEYQWQVRVWNGDVASPWSEKARFETAFLDVSAFDAPWISRFAERQAEETPETLLRKTFEVAGVEIADARLYVSGLGYYKAFINGGRVGDHELDPAFTPFDERVVYVTHDVTDLLQQGRNAIGISLGRGYFADFDNIDTAVAPWLSEPMAKAQLHITYADGSEQTIHSDSDWTVAPGPTLINNVKNGETYDARLEQAGWTEANFDDSAWQAAKVVSAPTGILEAQDLEPIRITGTLPAPRRSSVTDSIELFDFETTRAGWANITTRGPAGARIGIRYGEKLAQDGTVNSGNDGPFGGVPVQEFTYILKGDPAGETYTPSYSYAGYRFIEIERDPAIEVVAVEGQTLNTDVAVTGSFESSSELLNRYHDAMIRSTLSNMHSIPSDTPMYEKRGWAADALLISDNALINLASENFWEKWMLDHRYNQAADGGIAVIVPNQDPGEPQPDPFTGRTDDPIWSSSYVMVNYALYQRRANIRTLEENYPGMRRWMQRWMTELEGTGHLVTGRTWGDHEPAYGTGLNNYLVGTSMLYRSSTSLAEMADAIGKAEDADEYRAFAARLRSAINTAWFDTEAGVYDHPYVAPVFGPPPGMEDMPLPFDPDDLPEGSPFRSDPPEIINAKQFQTDNVLPMALGLAPEGNRDALCEALIEDVRDRHSAHITAGATVLKDVLPVLTECGAGDLAYQAAINPTFPGWGHWFLGLDGTKGQGGETIMVDTFWESWHEGARSHNHAFRGTIDDWLYEFVAGIRPTSPGYRTIAIKPYPVGDLTFARASIVTPLGTVSSAWEESDAQFVLNVSVPVGATATVNVPVRDGEEVSGAVGSKLVSQEGGYAIFAVPSGDFSFTSSRAD